MCTSWSVWFPGTLACLPPYLAIVAFLLTGWRRLRASREYRVSHLGTPSVWQAFTPAESGTVIVGALGVASLGGWGLWYAGAPTSWRIVCAAAMAVACAIWYFLAARIMGRPSSASDVAELGWDDDLLRFRAVRGLTGAMTWGAAALVYMLDYIMSSAFGAGYDLFWWPILGPVAVGIVVWLIFRQGRHLWRRAWLERDGSV